MKNLLLLILFFSSLNIYSQSFYTGEQTRSIKNNNEVIYDDFYKWKREVGAYNFKQNAINQSYSNLTQNELLDLSNWWDFEVNNLMFCPNADFQEVINYNRYLFRVLFISYLVEYIQDLQKYSENISCFSNMKSLVKNCKAKTMDMKKYIGRLSQSKERSKFNLKNDGVLLRLIKCNNSKCDYQKSCNKAKEELDLICSELDSYYGMSSLKLMETIISMSSALDSILDEQKSNRCLKRFVSLGHKFEEKNKFLVNIFQYVYKKLKKSNARYLEGISFVPGALKIFDMKGLSDFLIALPKAKLVKVKSAKLQKTFKIKANKRLVVKNNLVKKIQFKKTAKKVQVNKRLSEFEKAREMLNKFKLKQSIVNLKKFKKDFKITEAKIKIYNKKLRVFVTRKNLKHLRTKEKLGDKRNPIPLVFLDYLFIINDHQSLWNIVSIIGNSFYVYNNVEKIPGVVKIKIINNHKTNYKWNMLILKN